jgi:nanoRNase/pAp phosphatase (c-di-AMP/oligoRNAs hydrolase)
LVDTQPGTGNNPLSVEVLPDIVIDHHPIRRATRKVTFTDVRSNYGATSTILWEYLSEAQIAPNLRLATALLYGIRSDTQDLGRESSKADVEAMEALYPLANKRMLSQIQRGRVPSAYYQMLATALANTTIYGTFAISDLREVENPDMIGEVADLLLRHEKVNWTLCYGVHAGRMLLSLRTQDTQHDAGEVMRRIVYRIGTGGGHASMAGGQISLRPQGDGEPDRARLKRLIRERLVRAIRVTRRRGTQLVRLPDKRRKG